MVIQITEHVANVFGELVYQDVQDTGIVYFHHFVLTRIDRFRVTSFVYIGPLRPDFSGAESIEQWLEALAF